MRVLGVQIESPQTAVNRVLSDVGRVLSDVGAIARAARQAPAQLDRLLVLGEEIAGIGRDVLAIAERLDRRAGAIAELGERLDNRGGDLLELGGTIRDLGERIDSRGEQIVDRAARVAETGKELIAVLPTLERALEMASPLEGAIDRFGRLVDRLPGGAPRRRGHPVDPTAPVAPGPRPAPAEAPRSPEQR